MMSIWINTKIICLLYDFFSTGMFCKLGSKCLMFITVQSPKLGKMSRFGSLNIFHLKKYA